MGRITVSVARVNGVNGVSIFVPAADVVANAERNFDVKVTNQLDFCKAFCREVAREDIPTGDGEVTSLLAEAFQEALENAIEGECRGFISGAESRERTQQLFEALTGIARRYPNVAQAQANRFGGLLEFNPNIGAGLND